MLFAGVDAHRIKTHITIVNEDGKLIRAKMVESNKDGISEAFEGLNEPVKAVVEASYGWGPIYDMLGEHAEEVMLAHPQQVKAIANARIKTDEIDSRVLAHLLRTDMIPEAWASSPETRAVKRALRLRMFYVRVRTMVKNRIHALIAQHPVTRPDVRDLFGKEGAAWLQGLELPGVDGEILKEEMLFLRMIVERISQSDRMIRELAAGDEVVKILKSVPGIGEFFSVLIRHEVEDINRFDSAKKFASYTGVVPSTYASGSRVVHGRITGRGNKWLRWALVEAVSPAVTSSPYFRRGYERIKRRRGYKDARIATARKIAEIIWSVWKEGRHYYE